MRQPITLSTFTVTLRSNVGIGRGVFVAVLAARFRPLPCPTSLPHFATLAINPMCNRLQVFRPDTAMVSARVIKFFAIWNRPHVLLIRQNVGQCVSAANFQPPMPALVACSRPK